MKPSLEFRQRIGFTPEANGLRCVGCQDCPDIWELADGDFAIIGEDITEAARSALPRSAACGASERVIRLPRNVLINARQAIPEAV